MSLYTKLGANLWAWEPFRRLERSHDDVTGRCTKLFWLALYTTPEAKRLVPGLFGGSISTMADAAGIHVDDARVYLDRLLEDDLVDIDVERRVLRLTMLPDCGESPTNGNTIRGWWRKFQSVPECPVRDAHVAVLRWIIDEWSRSNGKPISHDHAAAWSETFGRVAIPSPRPRVRKHVQTTFFAAPSSLPKSSPSDSLSVDEPETAGSLHSGADLRKNKDIETNGRSFRKERDQDPDKDQDLGSPEEGGSGGGRPLLSVVPAVGIDDLITALSQATAGKFPLALAPDARAALGRAITAAGAPLQGQGALAVLSEYIERGMDGFPKPELSAEERARGGGISPSVVSAPGWIALALQHARTWKARVDDQSAMASAARKSLGFE